MWRAMWMRFDAKTLGGENEAGENVDLCFCFVFCRHCRRELAFKVLNVK